MARIYLNKERKMFCKILSGRMRLDRWALCMQHVKQYAQCYKNMMAKKPDYTSCDKKACIDCFKLTDKPKLINVTKIVYSNGYDKNRPNILVKCSKFRFDRTDCTFVFRFREPPLKDIEKISASHPHLWAEAFVDINEDDPLGF